MENWKRTGQGGNAENTGTETESGEKDGEEDMREKNGVIWTKGNIDQAGAKENKSI